MKSVIFKSSGAVSVKVFDFDGNRTELREQLQKAAEAAKADGCICNMSDIPTKYLEDACLHEVHTEVIEVLDERFGSYPYEEAGYFLQCCPYCDHSYGDAEGNMYCGKYDCIVSEDSGETDCFCSYGEDYEPVELRYDEEVICTAIHDAGRTLDAEEMARLFKGTFDEIDRIMEREDYDAAKWNVGDEEEEDA